MALVNKYVGHTTVDMALIGKYVSPPMDRLMVILQGMPADKLRLVIRFAESLVEVKAKNQ